MPEYDLNSDTPYGIASADWPVSFYDRPGLMFANLLRGDVDGMTRSMLSPDTLTPSQIKTVRDMLLKGKKPSPVMKTILDIATNPLVIMGLIVGLKFPMGSTKVLLDIRKGLLPKAAAMGKLASSIHGAMMNLRTIPNAFETLWGILRQGEKFATKWGTAANNIFVKAGKFSEAEGYLVSARLDGLHKSTHYAVKVLQNEPEWLAFMGAKDVPIAPNIQNSMRPELISAFDKLRNWFTGMRKQITSNLPAFNRIQRAVERKGYQAGIDVDDYFPRRAKFNKYRETKIRGTTGVNYRSHIRKDMMERVGAEEIQRLGGPFPNIDHLQKMEELGAVKKGFVNEVVRPIFGRWSQQAAVDVKTIWNDIAASGLNEIEQRAEFTKRVTEYYTKGKGKRFNFVARLGRKKAATDTLDAMGNALQNAAISGADAVEREFIEIGRVLAEPPQYSLAPIEAAQGYLNSLSSTWGYYGTGLGEKLWNIAKTPGIFRGAPHLETYLVDNIIPHVLGYKAWPQVQRSLTDAVRKEKIFNWIKNHPMVEQTLGAKRSKVLLDYFSKSGSSSGEAIGGQVANWFHISTLGLNLSATSANSMQTFITTLNNVGPKGLWRGLNGFAGQEGLVQKVGKYGAMLAKGIDKREAFNTAFPEFVAEMGEWGKSAERLISGDVAAMGFPKVFQAKGIWEKIKGYMMLPFSSTEAGNQLLAFYSGRNQHLFNNAAKLSGITGPARDALFTEAGKVGGSLSLLTQFAGGPLGIPSAIMNMNPMWRQYMHFPMRYLAYLHGSLRMGVDPSKLDWGTVGRALAGSTAAYIAARNMLGIDLSRGLMVGALPLPGYERAPFYPFPFVPPAAGVIGGIGKAIFTGSTEGLGSTAAMLLPGGIAARRAYRSFSPKFADYQNRTADGRIPLYNDDRALIGTLSPMQITLRALGIQSSTITGEQAASKWMLSQRDRIREYRREYLQALYENNVRRADKVNAEFQKVYPELGPITVKKSDIRAIENRKEISRLHRIARGLPSAYRPLFQQIVDEASIGTMTQDVETSSLGLIPQYLQ